MTYTPIFLPAAGHRNVSSLEFVGSGYYWSSSLYTDLLYCAWSLNFNSGNVNPDSRDGRSGGLSVRPVRCR